MADFRSALLIDGTHEPPELERAHDVDGRDEGDWPGCPRPGALSGIDRIIPERDLKVSNEDGAPKRGSNDGQPRASEAKTRLR